MQIALALLILWSNSLQMDESLPIFLFTEMQTTCPYCGRRTNFEEYEELGLIYQVHHCKNEKCGFTFIEMED